MTNILEMYILERHIQIDHFMSKCVLPQCIPSVITNSPSLDILVECSMCGLCVNCLRLTGMSLKIQHYCIMRFDLFATECPHGGLETQQLHYVYEWLSDYRYPSNIHCTFICILHHLTFICYVKLCSIHWCWLLAVAYCRNPKAVCIMNNIQMALLQRTTSWP